LLRTPEGAVIALEAHTLPLGLIDDAHIEVAHFGIEADCSLLLYTDGLVESERDLIDGLARLRAALGGGTGEAGAARRIYDEVLRGRSLDDVAILHIRSERAGDLRRWRFDPFWRDAVQSVRREVLEAVVASGVNSARAIDVEVVLAELVSNLLRYADGTVDLFLERKPRGVVLHLLDKGPGFQFNPRLPADPMSESGRGLFLIANLSDHFSVERRPGGGSHARIVFNVDVEKRSPI
jgi:anti-sigma regulatory factor (Ser/Thr protein kinase)